MLRQSARTLAHQLVCQTLTLSLKPCRQKVDQPEEQLGYRMVYSHDGLWLRRTPRPLYWKAKVVQGVGRGSRDLVS